MGIEDILGVAIDCIDIDSIPSNAIKIPLESFSEYNNIAGNVLKEFQELNQFKGVVKMTYDKGLGTLQKAKAGGYTGNIINDKGKIVGHVKLEDISKAAAVTSAAMSVMSIITSQYYLHEINKSIDDIQQKIDNISRFLEIDKKSHLLAREKYIDDIQNNMIDIQNNSVEKQAVLAQLQNLEIEAYSDYITNSELISNAIETLDVVKKQEDITETIEKIKDLLPQMWSSLYLYVRAKYLRMLLSETVDEKRINDIISSLRQMIADFEGKSYEFYVKSYDSVTEHDAYKVNNILFGAAKTFGSPMGVPNIINNKAIDGVKGKVQEKKEKEKQEAVGNLLDTFYYTCKDTEPMRKICDDIKFYNILYNQPVDIIMNDEEMYIFHGGLKTE